jgi:hypothetical protein
MGGAGSTREEQGERTSGTDIPKEIHTRLTAKKEIRTIHDFAKSLAK